MQKFLGIGDLKTRNLARGLLSDKNKKHPFKLIDRIRRECPANQMHYVTELLHSDQMLHPERIQSTFPIDLSKLSVVPRYRQVSLKKELAFQAARISKSRGKLIELIPKLSHLNKKLIDFDEVESIKCFKNIIECHGYSLFLFRKLAYMQISSNREGDTNDFVKELLKGGLGTIRLTYHAISDRMAS